MEEKALVIIRAIRSGLHRERHFEVDAKDCLTEARKRFKTTVHAYGAIVLVPQSGGPLRWTFGR